MIEYYRRLFFVWMLSVTPQIGSAAASQLARRDRSYAECALHSALWLARRKLTSANLVL